MARRRPVDALWGGTSLAALSLLSLALSCSSKPVVLQGALPRATDKSAVATKERVSPWSAFPKGDCPRRLETYAHLAEPTYVQRLGPGEPNEALLSFVSTFRDAASTRNTSQLHVVTADAQGGVRIVDLSDATAPRVRPGPALGERAVALHVWRNRALVVIDDAPQGKPGYQLLWFSLSSKTGARLLASTPMPGIFDDAWLTEDVAGSPWLFPVEDQMKQAHACQERTDVLLQVIHLAGESFALKHTLALGSQSQAIDRRGHLLLSQRNSLARGDLSMRNSLPNPGLELIDLRPVLEFRGDMPPRRSGLLFPHKHAFGFDVQGDNIVLAVNPFDARESSGSQREELRTRLVRLTWPQGLAPVTQRICPLTWQPPKPTPAVVAASSKPDEPLEAWVMLSPTPWVEDVFAHNKSATVAFGSYYGSHLQDIARATCESRSYAQGNSKLFVAPDRKHVVTLDYSRARPSDQESQGRLWSATSSPSLVEQFGFSARDEIGEPYFVAQEGPHSTALPFLSFEFTQYLSPREHLLFAPPHAEPTTVLGHVLAVTHDNHLVLSTPKGIEVRDLAAIAHEGRLELLGTPEQGSIAVPKK